MSTRPRSPRPLSVRHLRLTDLAAMRQFETATPVVQHPLSMSPTAPSFWRSMASAAIGRGNQHVLVVKTDAQLLGYALYRIHPSDQRWLLDLLVTDTGVYDPEPAWQQLIEAGIHEAGMTGAKRLYATAEHGSSIWQTLNDEHYMPFADETVLVARHVQLTRNDGRARPQQRSDTWAIHQLYIQSVPREVQQAEALTSHEWDIAKRNWIGDKREGWLIERENQVVAFIRITHGGGGACLEMLALPGESNAVAALLNQVLQEAQRRANPERFLAIVRGYQGELCSHFEDRGFHAVYDQDLMVRYTTVQQRAPAGERVHALELIGKRVPRRAASVPKEA